MSKIDYTQFYIKNYLSDKKNKKTDIIVKPVKKRRIGVYLLAALILIAALVYANVKLGNIGFDWAKELFAKQKDAHYYFVVKNFDSRDKAYAQSLLVRQSGGGGYIYQKQNAYFVAYTLFADKEDAQSVASKNKDAQIIVKRLDAKKYSEVIFALNELLSAALQFENGEIYESQFLEKCNQIQSNIKKEKERAVKENASGHYTAILELFAGGLASLDVAGATRVQLLSDLRYILSSVIISFDKL